MISEDLRKDLEALGLQDSDVTIMTMKDVIRAYKKVALKIHPDKAGTAKTAEFQDLVNSYQQILKYLNVRGKNVKTDENDEVDKFTKDNFENFNFPHENRGSFSVHVEDEKADVWEECIENLYGDPTIDKK